MAGFNGNPVARDVRNGFARVGPGAWAPLTSAQAVGGGSEFIWAGGKWIQIQARGPGALALAYTSRTRSGDAYATTGPTHNAQVAKIIPANSIWEEPLSEDVMLWGRFIAKAGSTAGGMKVVVTEYA